MFYSIKILLKCIQILFLNILITWKVIIKTLNMMTYFFLGVVSVSSIMDLLTTITINKTKELIPSEEKNIKTNILKNSTLNKVSNIIKTCFNGALFFTWGFFVKHSLLMTF